ncbi:MAG TPA: TorF family putative porin [Ramlibacter sp.]|nr:TorF family putative porin [Ramlibacter sp.]
MPATIVNKTQGEVMNTTMLRTLPLGLLVLALRTPCAGAQDLPAMQLGFNAALASDYRFRGISQSRLRPALQGGADLVHNPTGWYAGAWLSTIRWIDDAGGDTGLEVDLYAGKRGTIGAFTYDAGVLAYVYPSSGLATSPNTREVYLQGGYGPAWIKYSHAFSNLFGTPESKHSGYLDIGANLPLREGLVLNLHAGRQRVDGHDALSYNDVRIGLTRSFGASSVSLAVVGTDTDAYAGPRGRNLGKTGLVLTAATTF